MRLRRRNPIAVFIHIRRRPSLTEATEINRTDNGTITIPNRIKCVIEESLSCVIWRRSRNLIWADFIHRPIIGVDGHIEGFLKVVANSALRTAVAIRIRVSALVACE